MPQGFGGPFNVAKAMKQMQKLQQELQKLQEELAERTVEASSGGGAVTAVVDGSGRLRSVRIDPAAADPSDLEMLQDLVVAAVNEALRQSKAMTEQAMARLYADLGLPGVPGLTG
ncbi:MAG: YbaB/EbfC family nucleoid-associated protein [Limnochordaceae bacterium]|uniref:Nucleoid-associated protein U7230_00980 n=1 Tax=Carboxydichorda subterranea TaxID=3109565 RepID=A0ABZ1BXU7_9FIRM|nr:YbaB/EbfC family nucleoid-associated protein [Limnochorda sp. L945t]MBE3599130.1 YbaB/EbfC family nucleoid-associated protein [Limnochordaceae bacterium]WRP17622.1 YbaB/EbfC family nucleoid-associated protein [Limnochorda sp. L945t]